jgi:predicted DNA-binding antitoxin AbrB/MazE fold protein
MILTIEAIYEAGVFRPLAPLPDLQEQARVLLTLEPINTRTEASSLVEEQRQRRIQIEPHFAREIGDSHEYDLLGS